MTLPGEAFYMDAFAALSTCRAEGSGFIGHVPWTAMVAYADRERMPADLARAFVVIIAEMDRGFLAVMAKRMEKARKDRGKGDGAGKPDATPPKRRGLKPAAKGR